MYTRHIYSFPQDHEPFDFIEYFAGKGEMTRMLRYSGLFSAALDLKYTDGVRANLKEDYMDITTSAGFALLGCASEIYVYIRI